MVFEPVSPILPMMQAQPQEPGHVPDHITLSAGRLWATTAAVGTVLFVALLYWNHEAWIARRNIDRFTSMGTLDIAYLANELSPDALPTIVDQLASLPAPTQLELRAAIQKRYAIGSTLADGRWFEWNRSRIRASAAQRWLLLQQL